MQCAVPACDTAIRSRGWCSRHYQAWRKHGDPLVGHKRPRRRAECPFGHVTVESGTRSVQGDCRRCIAWRKSAAHRVMGWTEREFNERLDAQDRRCSICEHKFDLDPRTRHSGRFDHCHLTGKGRGIICNVCNIGIGLMGDDPDRLEVAVAYLRAPLMEVAHASKP